jgi:hypothetical protein
MSDKQSNQDKLHFILRALYFYKKTSGGDVPKKWDTTHPKNRSYFVQDYLNCGEHEHKVDTSKAGTAQPKMLLRSMSSRSSRSFQTKKQPNTSPVLYPEISPGAS